MQHKVGNYFKRHRELAQHFVYLLQLQKKQNQRGSAIV